MQSRSHEATVTPILLNMQSHSREATVMSHRRGVAASYYMYIFMILVGFEFWTISIKRLDTTKVSIL